jgi:hypothetical protein
MQKLGAYDEEPESSLKIHAKPQMQDICKKYENLKNVDKIAVANENLDEVLIFCYLASILSLRQHKKDA